MTPAVAERWLRYAIAFVWFATGSLVLHPTYREIGMDYLSRLGLGPSVMVATCIAEVGLAVYIVSRPLSAWLALGQVGTIVAFMLILGVTEPILLAHYLGMLTKNLPLMATLAVAYLLPREGWSPRVLWLLRVGMAIVWITEGLLPKILFQQSGEIDIVAGFGISREAGSALITVTGVAQVLSGVAALVLRGRFLRWLLAAQLAALVTLPMMVTFFQPLMWVHPFGPMTKNIPIIAGTFILLRTLRMLGDQPPAAAAASTA